MGGGWTVGKKLFTGVGALVVMLLLAGGTALWTLSSMKTQLDTATQKTAKKLDLALRLRSNAVALRSGQRRMLLAGYGNDQKIFQAATKEIDDLEKLQEKRLAEIEPLLVSAEGKKLVADISVKTAEWARNSDEVAKMVDAGKVTEAWALSREKCNPLIDEVDKLSDVLIEQQDKFLQDSVEAGDASVRNRPVDDGGAGHRLAPDRRAGRVGGARHHRAAAFHRHRAARRIRAGRLGRVAGQHLRPGPLPGLVGAGRLARGDVGVDGGDGLHDPQERRQLAAGRGADVGGRQPGDAVEQRARPDGPVDGVDPGLEQPGQQDHQDDRRDRVP